MDCAHGVPLEHACGACGNNQTVYGIAATLAERGKRYGDFTVHARIAQAIQFTMRNEDGWDRLTSDKAQALTVIADKIGRILSGDPEYRDNWHDIQGYAKLAEDRCEVRA